MKRPEAKSRRPDQFNQLFKAKRNQIVALLSVIHALYVYLDKYVNFSNYYGDMRVKRREYPIDIRLNKRHFKRIIIDPHYEKKHPEMNDELIIELVRRLDNQIVDAEDSAELFEYFAANPVVHMEKPYKLIFTTHLEDNFIGVINAFRVKRSKS